MAGDVKSCPLFRPWFNHPMKNRNPNTSSSAYARSLLTTVSQQQKQSAAPPRRNVGNRGGWNFYMRMHTMHIRNNSYNNNWDPLRCQMRVYELYSRTIFFFRISIHITGWSRRCDFKRSRDFITFVFVYAHTHTRCGCTFKRKKSVFFSFKIYFIIIIVCFFFQIRFIIYNIYLCIFEIDSRQCVEWHFLCTFRISIWNLSKN